MRSRRAVVGVAPGAPLVAEKVLDENGRGYTSWIVAGIDWVAANAASKNIEVANMSLGGSGSDDGNCGNSNNDSMHEAICNLVKTKGVTLVVAAGNSTRRRQTRRTATVSPRTEQHAPVAGRYYGYLAHVGGY